MAAVLGLRSGCSDRVIAGLRTRQGWAAPGGARKLLLEIMHRFAALPWVRKLGPLAPSACADRGRRGLPAVRWSRAGRKVHSCAGVPSAVTVSPWPVRGRLLDWCWRTISSTPFRRRCRFLTICGSNVPSRSRGTSSPTWPVPPVSTVLGRVPLRTFPAWLPAGCSSRGPGARSAPGPGRSRSRPWSAA